MKITTNKFYKLRNGAKVFIKPKRYNLIDIFDAKSGKWITDIYDNGRALSGSTDHHYDIVSEWSDLETGKSYKTRDGKHTVKVRAYEDNNIWPNHQFEGDVKINDVEYTIPYRSDGKQDSVEEHPLDLIPVPVEEWTIRDTLAGSYSVCKNGAWRATFVDLALAQEYVKLLGGTR